MQEQTIEEMLEGYLQLEKLIKEFKADQAQIKDKIDSALGPKQPGQTWEYDGVGTVSFVKGRKSKKLSPLLLMRKGITQDVIKECTEETEGSPHLRISGKESA